MNIYQCAVLCVIWAAVGAAFWKRQSSGDDDDIGCLMLVALVASAIIMG